MEKNKLTVFLAIAFLLMILSVLATMLIMKNLGPGSDLDRRANLLKLINRYIDKEEYDRALDKIEELLMENADDEEILELQDLALRKKSEKKRDDEFSDRLDKQKLYDSMHTMIEKTNEKPLVITRDKAPEKKQEDEKTKRLNKFIEEGVDAYNNQNYAVAKDRFLKALEIDDDNAEANAYLGATLYDQDPKNERNTDEAIKKLKKAVKSDKDLEVSHYKLAQIYNDRNLEDLAIQEYKETLRINPNNYLSSYELGRIYYKRNDFPNAQINFYNCVKIKTDFVNGYFYLANTEFKLDKTENAKRYYKKAASLDPNIFYVHANLGKIYKLEGDYSNSLMYYLNAVKLNNKYNYHKEIGDCYKKLNQPDRAITSYLTSISLNPRENSKDVELILDAYENLAEIEKDRGRYADSLSYIEKGKALNIRSAMLYYISAFCKNKLGKNSEAADDYLTAIDIAPRFIESYINLSSLYEETGEYNNALSIIDRGLLTDHRQYKLYNNKGSVHQKMNDFEAAVQDFKKSLELNPQDANIHYNLGICYKKLNDSGGAIRAFQQAINFNMKYYDAYYELGESYFYNKQYQEAKTILDLLLSRKPDYPKREQIEKMLSVAGT